MPTNIISMLNGIDNCVSRTFKSIKLTSLQWYICVWLVAWLSTTQQSVSALDELHIGGIFPINGKGGWQGGQACQPAAELALNDVNSKSDLLPGFKLTLYSNDSEVSNSHSYSYSFSLFFSHYFFSLFFFLYPRLFEKRLIASQIFVLFHNFEKRIFLS